MLTTSNDEADEEAAMDGVAKGMNGPIEWRGRREGFVFHDYYAG